MESSSQEVSIEIRHPRIYAILDFLMGCSTNHKSSSRVMEPENSFISLMKDAVLDSALVVDSHAAVNPSKEEQATNILKRHVLDSLPKFPSPRKNISAIRSFPPGCGRGAPRDRIQGHTESLQNGSLRTKRKHCQEASSKMKEKPTSFSGTDCCKPRLQSKGIPRNVSKYLEQDKAGKMNGAKEISTGVKLSGGFDNVKSGQEKLAATGLEPTGKRTVVQALMASQHCPWRQDKRMCKLELGKQTSQDKGLSDR